MREEIKEIELLDATLASKIDDHISVYQANTTENTKVTAVVYKNVYKTNVYARAYAPNFAAFKTAIEKLNHPLVAIIYLDGAHQKV